MLKRLILIFVLTASCYAQTDSFNIRLRHKPNEVHYCDIDGLMLRVVQPGGIVAWSFGKNKIVLLQLQVSFKFNEEDIIKCKNKKDTTFIQTKLVIVLDSLILVKKEEKKKYLTCVNQNKIISIERLDNDEAIKQYGELGKKGIVIIKTKRE